MHNHSDVSNTSSSTPNTLTDQQSKQQQQDNHASTAAAAKASASAAEKSDVGNGADKQQGTTESKESNSPMVANGEAVKGDVGSTSAPPDLAQPSMARSETDDDMDVGIGIHDDSDFDFELQVDCSIQVNREFERLFGWSQSEVKAMWQKSGGGTLHKFLVPVAQQAARRNLQDIYNTAATVKDRLDDSTYTKELDRICALHQKAVLSAESQFTADVIINTKWNRRLPCLMTGRFVPVDPHIQSNNNNNDDSTANQPFTYMSGISYVWIPIPRNIINECTQEM